MAGWGSSTGGDGSAYLSANLKQTSLVVKNQQRVCNNVDFDSSKIYCDIDSVSNSNACYGDRSLEGCSKFIENLFKTFFCFQVADR